MFNPFEQGMYTNDPRFCSAPRRSSRWIALDGAVAAFVSELDQTNAEERVALVTFGDDIPSYMCGRLPPATLDQTLTGDLTRISSRMTGWSRGVWNGNTNIAAGINTASDALTTGAGRRELSEKIMFVLTDGRAMNSLTLSAARNAASRGIKISTITFSVDADQLNARSGSNRFPGVQLHANSTTELVCVFRELAHTAPSLPTNASLYCADRKHNTRLCKTANKDFRSQLDFNDADAPVLRPLTLLLLRLSLR